ncbi:uncharacterized protein LOC111361012 isoform X2 [Spodoptera litura]|uniref:Uncharacterized protein LOC111361012 isoform X2 n=1 Tax=Spodoptera litura TaxID=69820 RepID=A0A9J7EQU0_SPOLT|nr:uncharacterized protein LOC111361012 isoform X2 [Spodoptera litura]
MEPFPQPAETPEVLDAVMQEESTASVSILAMEPILDLPLTSSQNVEHVFIQSTHEPFSDNPTEASRPAQSLVTTTATRSSRRRRGRRQSRQPLMSQEAARRALVQSAQLRAEATVRIAESFERMVQLSDEFKNTLRRIERIIRAAFPSDAEQENSS